MRHRKKMRKVLDYFIESESLDDGIGKVEVVEGYGAKPHKSVRCEIRVARVDKWKKEQKMPSKPGGIFMWSRLVRRNSARKKRNKLNMLGTLLEKSKTSTVTSLTR